MQVMAGRTVIVAAATIAMALVALAVINVALADELVQRDVFAAESVIDAADLDGLRGREGGQSITVATDQELTASVIGGRSEERRVRNECVRTCRFRWST